MIIINYLKPFCYVQIICIIGEYNSSCHAASMDLPAPLSPLIPILYCSQQVFLATSHIGTDLL